MKKFNTKDKKTAKRVDKAEKKSSILIYVFIAVIALVALFILYEGPDELINQMHPTRKFEHFNKTHEIIPTQLELGKTKLNLRSHPTIRKKRIAYAITITKDGNFQDGAAVLAYSIFNSSRNDQYQISLVAFVHPNVTTSRPVLEKLGYHVIESPTPINTSAIKFDFYREKIDKNGCCGAAELIKLNSYRLTQYDRVVHLDADTFLLNPIDEIFALNYSLVYTTDPNMASFKGEDKLPVQGGFIVFQPSVDDYLNIINILMTVEFRKGTGWNRTRIGWFWGGMTVQGVLPYYYNVVTAKNRTTKLDRCIYNTMADTEDCLVQTLDEIKSAHFTVCQKPWNCWKSYVNPLCGMLHRRWYELRASAEAYYGLKVNRNPCPRTGPQNYMTMQLDKAIVPPNGNFIRDDSPDILEPTGNSGFSF